MLELDYDDDDFEKKPEEAKDEKMETDEQKVGIKRVLFVENYIGVSVMSFLKNLTVTGLTCHFIPRRLSF